MLSSENLANGKFDITQYKREVIQCPSTPVIIVMWPLSSSKRSGSITATLPLRRSRFGATMPTLPHPSSAFVHDQELSKLLRSAAVV